MTKYDITEKIELKNSDQIKIMKEGGLILSNVMETLLKTVEVGIEVKELDSLAETQIRKKGAVPSFQMVPGYKWTICACINDVVVHGIPDNYKIQNDDLVGIDMGVFFKGFHTDSSWSVRVGNGKSPKAKSIDTFLNVGKRALHQAISKVIVGNRIYDISRVIEDIVTSSGYSIVKSLIGHGVGRKLHEAPEVPGFTKGKREDSPLIQDGLTIAVEIIYNMGGPDVVYKKGDGWTISTKDGKLSGLFETTVAATDHGVILLSKNYGPSGDN